MGNVLMRAVMSPGENCKAADVITKNLIGNNTGNMIFAASMYKTVLTDGTKVDTISTCKEFTKEQIERFNAEYDCFIIPLANAFRASFQKELRYLTKLVDQLNMPCVVAGVGLQAKLSDDVNQAFVFDKTVKDFMRAVLNKSSIVGVRGEYTARYLRNLGFREETDFTIIGCPSLYMYGNDLPIPEKRVLTNASRVSINYKIDLPEALHHLIVRSQEALPNFTFIPQSIEELRLIYAGVPYPQNKHSHIPDTYPLSLTSEIYQRDKILGFVNVQSWLDFLKSVDFSFGSRIHGNIAAVLAGTPCYIFAYDTRICELADYHKIPYLPANQITNQTDIFKVYEQTDFQSVVEGHKERFRHFIDFLNQNKVMHIYNSEGNSLVKKEDSLGQKPYQRAIHSFSSVSVKEQEERLSLYYKYLDKRYQTLKKQKEKTITKVIVKQEEQMNERTNEAATFMDKIMTKLGRNK